MVKTGRPVDLLNFGAWLPLFTVAMMRRRLRLFSTTVEETDLGVRQMGVLGVVER
ncbi:hypothetical protein [Sinorhizobium meliloti]|uniref:hypothetical protein n=1 Tax=Rhizobium meliloti TaxID=382 RepID=UPI0013E3C2F6|nr:hypothetical protein [Sinorhizobium meliloti]